MECCLYVGRVKHRRRNPVEHAFSFPLFMFYLDLDELDEVFEGRWLWSRRRPAFGRLRREDCFGDPDVPLAEAVRVEIARRTGRRVTGPVRMLTHLRYAGYVFNPLTVYYCFDRETGTLEAFLAEVTNTPWKERHAYAFATSDATFSMGAYRVEADKEMHVSPFMDMAVTYRFGLTSPQTALGLSIECRDRARGVVFDASLCLRRREIGTLSLLGTALQFPLMTMQVSAGIHWQALRLWWKGAPFHPHPGPTRTGLEGVR